MLSTLSMPYRILNWSKYQARTDRASSAWVKLWKDLLDSADFYCIPETRRWEWPCLLLLSKKHDGVISDSDEQIAFRLYKTLDRPFDPTPFLGRLLEPIRLEDLRPRDQKEEIEEEHDSGGHRSRTTVDQPTPLVTTGNHRGPDETFIKFVCIDGSEWPLPESDVQRFEETYGTKIDVRRELRKAREWCEANPGKRKQSKGMARFLTNWLNGADAPSRNGRSVASVPAGHGPSTKDPDFI